MSKTKVLSLAVVGCDNKLIQDLAVLSKLSENWKRIVPKRKPDLAKGENAAWIIKQEHRRRFGNQAVQVLEDYDMSDAGNPVTKIRVHEELHGFFSLVGIGKRWVDSNSVLWCLHLGVRRLKTGMKL